MESKKQPEIRISGFFENWKESALGDLLIERNDQISENSDYKLMSFVKDKGVVPKGDRYDRSFLVKSNNKKYKKTKLGDFIYSSNNLETGSIGFNKFGKALISPVYSIFSSKGNKESQYIGIVSQRKDFIGKMIRYRQGVVYGQWRIHEKDFLNIRILIPNEDEQNKLVNFFQQIDNSISLHQEKLSMLKQTKEGFLEKMFPKEDENIPEVRFPGFTDSWKRGNLGEHSAIHGRVGWKSLKQEEYTDEGPRMIAGRFINAGKIDWSKADHIPQWRYEESPEIALQNGDVIFTKDGSRLGNPAVVRDISFQATINGTMMLVRPDSTIKPSFLYQVLCSKSFNRLINTKVSGSGIPHLFQSDMKSFHYGYSSIEEQEKIGSFLGQLDETIALHQRELELIQLTKKAFLQKLFV